MGNEIELRVIGAGLSRTGTLSTRSITLPLTLFTLSSSLPLLSTRPSHSCPPVPPGRRWRSCWAALATTAWCRWWRRWPSFLKSAALHRAVAAVAPGAVDGRHLAGTPLGLPARPAPAGLHGRGGLPLQSLLEATHGSASSSQGMAREVLWTASNF